MVPVHYDRLVSRPYIRTLRALEEGALRFNQLERATGLDSKTVDRILKALVRDHFVFVRALPKEGTRTPAEYRIAPRGSALLDVQVGAARAAERHRSVLGEQLVDEILSAA